MTLNRFTLTAALLASATLASAPAFAQERDAKKREAVRSGEATRQPDRGGERAQAKREATREAPPQATREAPRQATRDPQREATRDQSRRDDNNARRNDGSARADRSVQPDRSAQAERRRDDVVVGRAVPRSEPRRDDGGRSYDRDRRDGYASDRNRRDGYSSDRDRRYGYSSRGYYPRTYYRPYTFRPHLSIGFGIFAGYPVPYAWTYSSPIYVYGYRAPRAPVYITPGAAIYGGVALEIEPYDADVFVDGNYAGKVEEFDGTSQPMTLVSGTHRVEVQAPGYAPLIFDVTVQPGQVIPYRGELRPY